jgi:hypothetical protein
VRSRPTWGLAKIFAFESSPVSPFATNLTEYSAGIFESARSFKSEHAMNEIDVFVVAFGIAFFVASDRFKRLLSFLGLRNKTVSKSRG